MILCQKQPINQALRAYLRPNLYTVPQGGIINGVLVVCGYYKCYAYGNDAWSQIGEGFTQIMIVSSGTVLKGTAYLQFIILALYN